jgi:tRNA dimethylallyltransferase
MNKLPKLVVILGPTASGKTDLAIFLAKKFSAEIVNADSRTIYRGMDVGTAKPPLKCLPLDKGEREGVNRQSGNPSQPPLGEGRSLAYFYKGFRHYLFNLINPDERFSAADFKNAALSIIYDIISRGKTPFLVGGTGLYIDAITKNLSLGEAVPPNKKLRKQFEKDLKNTEDIKEILNRYYLRILKLDPEIKIDKNNPRRIIRALEICLAGKKFSKQEKRGEPLFQVLEIGVKASREELHKRINHRVDKMISAGLEKEVRALVKKYGWSSPGMSAIGYREWKDYLAGKVSKAEVAELIRKNTRHYAKRQMTWFGRDKKIKWVSSPREAENRLRVFIPASESRGCGGVYKIKGNVSMGADRSFQGFKQGGGRWMKKTRKVVAANAKTGRAFKTNQGRKRPLRERDTFAAKLRARV